MKAETSITVAAILLMAVLMAKTPDVVARVSEKSKEYNPMGLMGSGFGRTISRMLTTQADFTFHFGNPYPVGGIATTPIASIIQSLSKMATPPSRKTPPSIAESAAALSRTEGMLSLAFNLDTSYYPAYSIYFMFLTERPTAPHVPSSTSEPAMQATEEREISAETCPLALDITHRALYSYRIEDPEQSVAAALATYNQYTLIAPLIRTTDVAAFRGLTRKAADEMTVLLENANKAVIHQEWNGLWLRRSAARREDYAQAHQLASKIKETLNKILEKQSLPKTEKSR